MKISILNYLTGEVKILDVSSYTEEHIESAHDFLESLGYNLNQIAYMVTDYINLSIYKV